MKARINWEQTDVILLMIVKATERVVDGDGVKVEVGVLKISVVQMKANIHSDQTDVIILMIVKVRERVVHGNGVKVKVGVDSLILFILNYRVNL